MAIYAPPVPGRPQRLLNSRYVLPSVVLAQYSLTVDSGSYAVTGKPAGLTPRYAAGSYSLTGTAVTFTWSGRILHVDSGSYSIVGAQSFRAITLTLGSGSYTLTGTDATLKIGYKAIVDVGSYAISGQDTTLTQAGGAVEVPHLLACMGYGR